jgi:hypothetical protein
MEKSLGHTGLTCRKTIRLDRLSVPLSLRSDGPTDKVAEMDPSNCLDGQCDKNSRKNGTSPMDLSDGPKDKVAEMDPSDCLDGQCDKKFKK